MADTDVIDVPVGQRTCVRCRWCVGGDHLGPISPAEPYNGHNMAYCTSPDATGAGSNSCPAQRHLGACGPDGIHFESRQ